MTDPHELAARRKEVEEGGGATWSNWQLPQAAGAVAAVIDNQDLYAVTVRLVSNVTPTNSKLVLSFSNISFMRVK
jgi:hypothetical protein